MTYRSALKFEGVENEFFEQQYADSHWVIGKIMPFSLYILGIIATLETFLSYFSPVINRGPLDIILIIVAIINYDIFYLKKHSIYVALAYVAAVVISFLTNWTAILNSIIKMLNLMMIALEQNGKYELVRFRYLSYESEPTIAYAIVILTVLIATILAIGIFYGRVVYAALIVLPASLYGLFFDAAPNKIWLSLVIIFLAGLLTMNREASIVKWCKAWLEAVAIIIIPLIVMLLCVNERNFSRWKIFEPVEAVVNDVADRISDVLGFDLIPIDRGKVDLGVGGGMLTNLDLSDVKNGIAFKMVTGKVGSNLYLKSYVGATYGNNSWKQWDMDNFAMKDNSINPYNQSYIINDIVAENLDMWYCISGFSLSNKNKLSIRMDKPHTYFYIPYAGNYAVRMAKWDTYPVNPPLKYESEYYINAKTDYSDYRKMLSEYTGNDSRFLNYIKWESEYRKYVYDNYACITEDVLKDVELPFDFRRKRSYEEVDEYIDTIKEYLADFEYTLSPPELPEGMDYVKFFLCDSKKGYCVNFASAGALLLKYAGIPARYVEGFCIRPEVIEHGGISENYNGKKQYSIDVEAKNAHAWVEVYKDGYGWVPVEFTVGYYLQNANTGTVVDRPEYTEAQTQEQTFDEPDEDDEPDEEETEPAGTDTSDVTGGTTQNNLIVFVLVPLIIVVILLIIIIIRCIVKVIKLNRLLSIKNVTKEKFFKLYYYMEKLLAENGLTRADSTDYSEFEQEVYNNLRCFTKEEIHDIMEMVLKAKFSEEKFADEWYEKLLEASLKIRRETYDKAGLFKKIVLSVIKVY
ncbi:MAG: transglutaminase family protein [Lachnospiraceae bacterium]